MEGRGVSGQFFRSAKEQTHKIQGAARPAHSLRRGAERRQEAAAEGRGVSGQFLRSGKEQTYMIQCAARPAHQLRRGADAGGRRRQRGGA